MLQQIFY